MMPMLIRATESSVMKYLHKGEPLPPSMTCLDEDLRLPVFHRIDADGGKKYSIAEPRRIIVASARKEVWYVQIFRRANDFGPEEGAKFIENGKIINGAVGANVEVRGWLVTTGAVEEKTRKLFKELGHLITEKARPR